MATVISAELSIREEGLPLPFRFFAFVFLIMVWGTLRCDDCQNVNPMSLALSQLGLSFKLRRTKTSGPGKQVGELTGFIARAASLVGDD